VPAQLPLTPPAGMQLVSMEQVFCFKFVPFFFGLFGLPFYLWSTVLFVDVVC
jgi:hypothetical protein